jgi:uncharacterized radical SAM superfamily Fe-S cluster-containing enzyme
VESVCGHCLGVVPASINALESGIYVSRICPTHGEESILIESETDYFERQTQIASPNLGAERVYRYPEGVFVSRQSTKAVVIEVTEDCNETCKTCIAGSFAGKGNFKGMGQILLMLDAVTREADLDVVIVSGGEPTIHPDIVEIIEAIYRMGAKHVILISNGRRFAEDPEFCESINRSFPELEVFLQFDSVHSDVMIDLRGSDLVAVRTAAAMRLAEAGIHTTFVSIAKEGKSLATAGELVDFAMSLPNVRGVNFQPLRASGRHDGGTLTCDQAPSIGRLIQKLSQQLPFVSRDDIVPHPVAPGSIAAGYWRKGSRPQPLTDFILQGLADPVQSHPFVPPSSPRVFRILIVNYMDRFNLRSDLVAQAPIFVVTPLRSLLPLDLYYLLGEEQVAAKVPVVLRMSE